MYSDIEFDDFSGSLSKKIFFFFHNFTIKCQLATGTQVSLSTITEYVHCNYDCYQHNFCSSYNKIMAPLIC